MNDSGTEVRCLGLFKINFDDNGNGTYKVAEMLSCTYKKAELLSCMYKVAEMLYLVRTIKIVGLQGSRNVILYVQDSILYVQDSQYAI